MTGLYFDLQLKSLAGLPTSGWSSRESGIVKLRSLVTV